MSLILLVEDNHDIAEMVGDHLEQQGYEVDYAADGITGLHLAVTHDFDAIVLDLMLPGMDGLDVCRKLRADAGRSTPLLMLTARDTLEDKVAGLDAGADDYLVKPFELEELDARLRAMLRRAGGDVAAVAARAHDGPFGRALQLAHAILELGERNVLRLLDAEVLPFARAPHVEHPAAGHEVAENERYQLLLVLRVGSLGEVVTPPRGMPVPGVAHGWRRWS